MDHDTRIREIESHVSKLSKSDKSRIRDLIIDEVSRVCDKRDVGGDVDLDLDLGFDVVDSASVNTYLYFLGSSFRACFINNFMDQGEYVCGDIYPGAIHGCFIFKKSCRRKQSDVIEPYVFVDGMVHLLEDDIEEAVSRIYGLYKQSKNSEYRKLVNLCFEPPPMGWIAKRQALKNILREYLALRGTTEANFMRFQYDHGIERSLDDANLWFSEGGHWAPLFYYKNRDQQGFFPALINSKIAPGKIQQLLAIHYLWESLDRLETTFYYEEGEGYFSDLKEILGQKPEMSRDRLTLMINHFNPLIYSDLGLGDPPSFTAEIFKRSFLRFIPLIALVLISLSVLFWGLLTIESQ